MFFILNDIFPKIDLSFLKYGFFSRSPFIFYIIFKDLNIFSEKKTNLGLFFLTNNLNFHFYIEGKNFIIKELLLNIANYY